MQKRVPRTREYIDHRLGFFNGTGDLLDMFEIGFFNIGYIGARCACQPKNCQYIPTQMILLFKLPPWYPVNSCKKSVQRTREYINHRLRFFNGTEDLLDMFEIGTFNIVNNNNNNKWHLLCAFPIKTTAQCALQFTMIKHLIQIITLHQCTG